MAVSPLIFLHGFLGEGHDWNEVLAMLPSREGAHAPDYTMDKDLAPTTPLNLWGEALERWILKNKIPEPVILVGYSQGGRLALHALEKMSDRVRGVVLISTNPGLREDEVAERATRHAGDKAWATRFETESWSKVMSAWNDQGVFQGGRAEPPRRGTTSERKRAAAALRNWSVSLQEDFRPLIEQRAKDLLWIYGENDEKYRELSIELRQQIPVLETRGVPGAGHRVPWDQPGTLADVISEFAGDLDSKVAVPSVNS